MQVVGRLAWGVLVAAVCGAVLGALARLAMHFVAVSAGLVPAFHWSATAGIMMIFVIAALPGAVTAVFTSSRWRWLPLALVPLLLCIPAVGVLSEELHGARIEGFRGWAGVLGWSALVFACILALGPAAAALADRVPLRRRVLAQTA